ncbi:MAG: hypothetical protein E6I91_03110 [Chloroflexi bacterium]|nr:MAG: hypothetical protein E6I91_03110 [Chloroflexota bacterium]
MLGFRYLPHNFVEGCRVGAVQWVDGHVPFVATATKAEIGQDTYSHDRAAHASPDDMPYTSLPDFSRLCFYLLQHGIVCKQALHTLDPIKLERPILAA